MSAKLLLHTALCLALAGVLVSHIRAGRRRIVLGVMLVSVLLLGAAPFMYRIWPGGMWPRMTIHWAQVLYIATGLAAFVPGMGRPIAALHDRYDFPATDRAPLEPEVSRHLYH